MKLYIKVFLVSVCYLVLSPCVFNQFVPQLRQIGTISTFFFQALIIVLGLIALINIKGRYLLKLIFLSFLLSTLVTIMLGKASIVSNINGLREVLPFFFVLFIFEYILRSAYSSEFRTIATKWIKIFLFIQIPISIVQVILYRSGDPVGGSFGNKGMGVQTIIIFISTLYVLLESKEITKKLLFFILLCFIPLIFNQTKAAFVLLPIWFGLIMINRKKYYLLIVMGIITAFSMGVLIKYVQEFRILSYYITDPEFIDNTLFRTEGDTFGRFAKIQYMFDFYEESLVNMFFGSGYGLFSGHNLLGLSRFAAKIQFLALDNKPLLFTAGFQGGIISLILTAAFLFYFAIPKPKDGLVYGRRTFKMFLSIITIFLFVYLDSIYNLAFIILFGYFLVDSNIYKNDIIHSNR